jgi:hypothetical protein
MMAVTAPYLANFREYPNLDYSMIERAAERRGFRLQNVSTTVVDSRGL